MEEAAFSPDLDDPELAQQRLSQAFRDYVWSTLADTGEQVGLRIAGQQAHDMADLVVKHLTHAFTYDWRPGNRLEERYRCRQLAAMLIGMSKEDAVRVVTQQGIRVALRDDPTGWYTDEYENNRITITALEGVVTQAIDG